MNYFLSSFFVIYKISKYLSMQKLRQYYHTYFCLKYSSIFCQQQKVLKDGRNQDFTQKCKKVGKIHLFKAKC